MPLKIELKTSANLESSLPIDQFKFNNKSNLDENNIINFESFTLSLSESEESISFKANTNGFEIVVLKFDFVKNMGQSYFYTEVNNKIYIIECKNATLVSNKDLAIGINDADVFTIKKQNNTSNKSVFSVLSNSTNGATSYINILPSFSITFYNSFDFNQLLFKDRFDSIKDSQVINSFSQSGITTFFAKIIIDPLDNFQSGIGSFIGLGTSSNIQNYLSLCTASTSYALNVYQYLNNNSITPVSFNVYKITDTDLGSVYFSYLSLSNQLFNGFVDGTKFFLMSLNQFSYIKKYNISLNISSGPYTPTPSPVLIPVQKIQSNSSSLICCIDNFSEDYPGNNPVFTANWPSSVFSPDSSGYLNDNGIPDVNFTYQSVKFSSNSNLPIYQNQNYIGINAQYVFNSSQSSNLWQFSTSINQAPADVSLCYIALDDIGISTINFQNYTVKFFYYYQNINNPDTFVLNIDSTTSKIINNGSGNYFIQSYFNFGNNLRNLSKYQLNAFQVQLTKITSNFPNEFRLIDFKIYRIYCPQVPTPTPAPAPAPANPCLPSNGTYTYLLNPSSGSHYYPLSNYTNLLNDNSPGDTITYIIASGSAPSILIIVDLGVSKLITGFQFTFKEIGSQNLNYSLSGSNQSSGSYFNFYFSSYSGSTETNFATISNNALTFGPYRYISLSIEYSGNNNPSAAIYLSDFRIYSCIISPTPTSPISPYNLTVNAKSNQGIALSGIPMVISPPDSNGLSNGNVPLNRNYSSNTIVDITAPIFANPYLTYDGPVFIQWEYSNLYSVTIRGTTITFSASPTKGTATAIYTTPTPVSPTPTPVSPTPTPVSPTPIPVSPTPTPVSPTPTPVSPTPTPVSPSPIPTSPTPSPSCVIYGTKIKISEQDSVNVEELKVGDKILGLNSDFEHEYFIIENISYSIGEVIYKLNFENRFLTCSESHCIFIQNNEIFKHAYAIKKTDQVRFFDGLYNIKSIEILKPAPVISLKLSNDGCYFANDVLSHTQIGHPNLIVKKYSQSPVALQEKIFRVSADKCVAMGSNILMFDRSYKKVEALNLGDIIMGSDENGNDCSFEILNKSYGFSKFMYQIELEDGILECSDTHCIFSYTEYNYAYPWQLKIGDYVKGYKTIKEIKNIKKINSNAVVSLNLSPKGNYFANGVLGHSEYQALKINKKENIFKAMPVTPTPIKPTPI
jgi:hypothetical protein